MSLNSDGPRHPPDKLRAALLCWYPFPGGERALLLGENSAPLRPTLERHYARVESAALPGREYECIVAVDIVERQRDAAAYLRELAGLLKENGVLLLGFQNRFALRSLCGGLDEHVSVPFSGAADGVGARGEHLYAREEMRELLQAAGFAQVRYYYPMPDGGFPQAVYTDEYPPRGSIRDRVFPYDPYGSPFIASEKELYDAVVREQALPFVANYYLAECRKAPAPGAKKVLFAALSADRGEEHGFATVLYDDETACKIPISPAGIPSLKHLCENAETLARRGICTVEQRFTDKGVEMPLVREPALLLHLQQALQQSADEALTVLDLLQQDVLASSDHTELTPEEALTRWDHSPGELGEVLCRAYIDMIPYNAFWSDGRIRYYDQEFTVDRCPAKYVLFRALRYTWLHIPEAEAILPLEQAKAHFGLTGLWDIFQRREDAFVAENRNYDRFRELYRWADIDLTQMPWRRQILLDQRRQELDLLADIHAVQLEMLHELDRVCALLGVRYMAIHGTLLGAARHRGFIPWDDDVDIAMPRADYDRLLREGRRHFPSDYFLQTPYNDFNCYYGGYCRLRLDGTTALEPQNAGKDASTYHSGIWIDIFPLDPASGSTKARRKKQKRLAFFQRILYAKAYPNEHYVPRDVPGIKVSLYYFLARCIPRRSLARAMDRLCRRGGKSELRGILACYYGNRENPNTWEAEQVAETVELPFEDMCLPVPKGWDEILRKRYGENYMTPPPADQRYRHYSVMFDPGRRSG